MPSAPPPPPVPDDDPAAWAAGLLDPAAAAALERRAATDPALAARLRAERALETTLAADGLAPLPLPFVAKVLAAVRAAPRAPWERPVVLGLALPRWARSAAAALLVGAGGWLTLAGIEPVAAAADTLAASSPAPTAVLATSALPKGAGPAPWTQGPSAGARDVAASIANEAVRLPGGPTGLVAVGAALLGAALATARVVSRPRANGGPR
ncbi:MAG: hypothetical protein JNM10_10310 [Planctomycetia bacterium]|nr:hypothetical protein [Planctomycetia bacterium]